MLWLSSKEKLDTQNFLFKNLKNYMFFNGYKIPTIAILQYLNSKS